MRMVYGVFGYGRGHATRAHAVLPELQERHEVFVFAGGDAYDALCGQFPVVRIPTLGYVYGDAGRRSLSRTLAQNAHRFRDVLFGGAGAREVTARMAAIDPDVAICDAKPWTHHAAARLGVPRISFDHFGILAWCRPELGGVDRVILLEGRRGAGRFQRFEEREEHDHGAQDHDVQPGEPLQPLFLARWARRGEGFGSANHGRHLHRLAG